jgi:hypothetical protein
MDLITSNDRISKLVMDHEHTLKQQQEQWLSQLASCEQRYCDVIKERQQYQTMMEEQLSRTSLSTAKDLAIEELKQNYDGRITGLQARLQETINEVQTNVSLLCQQRERNDALQKQLNDVQQPGSSRLPTPMSNDAAATAGAHNHQHGSSPLMPSPSSSKTKTRSSQAQSANTDPSSTTSCQYCNSHNKNSSNEWSVGDASQVEIHVRQPRLRSIHVTWTQADEPVVASHQHTPTPSGQPSIGRGHDAKYASSVPSSPSLGGIHSSASSVPPSSSSSSSLPASLPPTPSFSSPSPPPSFTFIPSTPSTTSVAATPPPISNTPVPSSLDEGKGSHFEQQQQHHDTDTIVVSSRSEHKETTSRAAPIVESHSLVPEKHHVSSPP